jgi:hypothetical protein
MTQSSFFLCPICETTIPHHKKDKCSHCGWILTLEENLDPDRYNLLVNWARDCYSPVDELQSRNDYKNRRLNDRIDRQRIEIDRMQAQIDEIFQFIPRDKQKISSAIESISGSDPVIIQSESIVNPEVERMNENSHDPETIVSPPKSIDPELDKELHQTHKSHLTQQHQQIISEYYSSPNEFTNRYHPKIATITKDNINNNWGNEQKIIILTEADRGNYWIFDIDNTSYLVPFIGKYFNPHNYQILNTIFDCNNYTSDYQNMQLLAAAIVTIEGTINPQTWRLQEQGKLLFR